MAIALDRNTIEWEAARVACAFGVEEWETGFRASKNNFSVWQFISEGVIVHCQWDEDFWLSFRVGLHAGKGREVVGDGSCQWRDYEPDFDCIQLGHPIYNGIMARAMYCLGFPESVLQQLPPLSAHEQLELKLTMPREFWPQKWLDEG